MDTDLARAQKAMNKHLKRKKHHLNPDSFRTKIVKKRSCQAMLRDKKIVKKVRINSFFRNLYNMSDIDTYTMVITVYERTF